MIHKIWLFIKCKRGQAIVEYGLVIILTAIFLMTMVGLLGNNISGFMSSIVTGISEYT